MNKATSARPANRFERGSGMYACRLCGRNTRSTGRGDNEGVRLCEECFELAGEENHLSDNGGTFYGPAEEILSMIASIARKGGDASKWDHLKVEAEKQIAAKTAPAPVASPLIMKPSEAGAVWIAMAHLNDVGLKIRVHRVYEDGSGYGLSEKEGGEIRVRQFDVDGETVVAQCYADQAAFAKAYGL